MGSDQETKNELEADCLSKADLYVCDKVSQAMRLGELRSARARGLLLDDPPELSDIITGSHQGRQSQSDITIADLTGMGVQDTAIASYALKVFEQH
jgi:ornithine cyclodeaminase